MEDEIHSYYKELLDNGIIYMYEYENKMEFLDFKEKYSDMKRMLEKEAISENEFYMLCKSQDIEQNNDLNYLIKAYDFYLDEKITKKEYDYIKSKILIHMHY